MASVTFKGNPVALAGDEVRVGHQAPDFTVQKTDMSDYALNSTVDKTRIIACVPSLDTPVCDAETRRFSKDAAGIPNTEVITVSVDLPFAQGRFCKAANINNVKTLSDHRDVSFGKAYGTLIKEARLLSRAIFVVDPSDTVTYVEYVKEVTDHPNYDAALSALKQKAGAH